MATKAPEARQHHVVPASYLAAFANDGSKDGRLFVWSPEQRRVWPSTPRKTGKERDYYRIDKEGVDPLAAENALGEIEAETAPLIRRLIDTGRLPNREDFEVVLLFVALLEARGRSMRALLEDTTEQMGRIVMQQVLTTPALWEQHKQRILGDGCPPERIPAPGALLDAIDSGRVRITVPQNGRVTWVGQSLLIIFPLLQQRTWHVVTLGQAVKADFITGDRPLVLATTRPEPPSPYGVGIGSGGTDLTIALGPRTLLLGRYEDAGTPIGDELFAAMMNSRVLNRSYREVYSARDDFAVLGRGQQPVSAKALIAGGPRPPRGKRRGPAA